MPMTLRKADIKDVPKIQQLIAVFAKQDLMLSRSLIDLYEYIRDYFVVFDKNALVGAARSISAGRTLQRLKPLQSRIAFKVRVPARALLKPI